MEVSSSGYYEWLNGPESERSKQDKRLLKKIHVAHRNSRETYGYPRIHADLLDQGERCGRKRIYRLMRDNGIQAKMAKKQRRGSEARHFEGFKDNVLNRQFYAENPNQRWVSDITMVPTQAGWLYLAVVMDLYSRAVVGWAMGQKMTTTLVNDALVMALWRRGNPKGVLVHSDQGSQYRSTDYQALLKKNGLECSMSRKGNCWDNAAMESFFHTMKTELTHHKRYRKQSEAKQYIFEYIEVFYNQKRRHSYLEYRAPFEYEKLMSSEK